MEFDVNNIRKDFPILGSQINDHPLIYLDNAASTQKPQVVIDKIAKFYSESYSNIHRAVHSLSKNATKQYDEARNTVKEFINAEHFEEIIFTRGATESINLVASTWGRSNLNEGEEVIITEMEHHSNIIPWQIICDERKAKLKIIPMTDDCELIISEYRSLLSEKTKFVSLVHISNSLGTINPIKEMIDDAHKVNAKVLIDGAQSIQHKKIDVQELDCDFFVFSGHKIYGPNGIGVLFGKKELLENMPPYQGGGDMILSVSFERSTYNYLPFKFEAGTPNIAGAIGLGTALNYVSDLGIENIDNYENSLLNIATRSLNEIDDLKIIGNAKDKASVISFIVDNTHPTDIGIMLDLKGVAVRTGHHCTEPVMRKFKLSATARASFSFYNTQDEVEQFVEHLKKVINLIR